MNLLHFDIETIPTTDPKIIQELTESIKPPRTMSKPETIAKWEAEEKPGLIDDVVSRTALDGSYGSICCISYAREDDEVETILDRDEKKLLTKFFVACEAAALDSKSKTSTRLTAVGHAISSFDLRFVWQRAIINKVKPTICMPWNEGKYSEHVQDTMSMWNPDKDKRISLHKLCLILGIPSPKENGVTGADVARLWAQRRYYDIIGYSVGDVVAARDCFRRLSLGKL